MKKYLRNKNFLYLTISLAAEFVFSLILIVLLLAFAKHYNENNHHIILLVIGISLLSLHGVTVFFGTIGLISLDKAIVVTLPKAYQKATYWNALILGWLFYPVFVAWYAYRHSGFSEEQIHDFTKKYIYKNFALVSDLTEVATKLDEEFKVEHANVKLLIKEKQLTTAEGHKYLFDYLFNKNIITEDLLRQVEEKNIEKIIEDAN